MVSLVINGLPRKDSFLFLEFLSQSNKTARIFFNEITHH